MIVFCEEDDNYIEIKHTCAFHIKNPNKEYSKCTCSATYEPVKSIVNFSEYLVDTKGNVYSIKYNKYKKLKLFKDKDGYFQVSLSKDGKKYNRKVHRLILETFVGPCPEGMEACHDPDHDKCNNNLNNLRWDTPSNAKLTR